MANALSVLIQMSILLEEKDRWSKLLQKLNTIEILMALHLEGLLSQQHLLKLLQIFCKAVIFFRQQC